MPKEKYGQAFAEGINRNRRALGIPPKMQNVNIPFQTLKYLPGEVMKAPFKMAGGIFSSIRKRIKNKGRS